MKAVMDAAVARKFASYPPGARRKLMALRRLILDTAATTEGVGALQETLKWGEPAYVTAQTGSGSTVRIDWKKSDPGRYAMYFNCQTSLVETFRTIFSDDFTYEGNRALVFEIDKPIPQRAVKFCIAASLTYHLAKRTGPKKKRTSS
jgi:Domain of unknown function (DU1801)